jgi:hypothetical protein
MDWNLIPSCTGTPPCFGPVAGAHFSICNAKLSHLQGLFRFDLVMAAR